MGEYFLSLRRSSKVPRLFRDEAGAAKAATVFGGIFLPRRRCDSLFAGLAVVLSLGVLFILTAGSYTQKERAVGYLVPGAGVVDVVSPVNGILTSIDVREGEPVRQGDLLFVVASSHETAAGVDAGLAQVQGFRTEERRLVSQIRGEHKLMLEAERAASERAAHLEVQLELLKEQQTLASSSTDLLERDGERLRALGGNGHVPASVTEARMREVLEARRDVLALAGEIAGTRGELHALASERARLPLALDARLNELHSRLAGVRRSLAEAEAARAIIVRASVSGRVSSLLAHSGMVVAPGRLVLSIVPGGGGLQAEILVPARAAGFVRNGQPVALRYDAFPYQKFGLHEATIASISGTVLDPDQQPGPVRLPIPAYRVVARLERETVIAYGRTLELRPGLTFEADVVRDRRRIMEWLLEPVFAAAKGL